MTAARLLLVDETPVPWWALWRPEPWFTLGAGAAELLGSFDRVVACRRAIDVYDALLEHQPADVQVWGHGAPGRPFIGGQPLTARNPAWRSVRGSVWFRSCEVAKGPRGIAFMNEIAAQGVDVAAHVSRISGAAQSYLVGVRAHGRSWWPADFAPLHSNPLAPRTVSPLEMTLPAWAFERGHGL